MTSFPAPATGLIGGGEGDWQVFYASFNITLPHTLQHQSTFNPHRCCTPSPQPPGAPSAPYPCPAQAAEALWQLSAEGAGAAEDAGAALEAALGPEAFFGLQGLGEVQAGAHPGSSTELDAAAALLPLVASEPWLRAERALGDEERWVNKLYAKSVHTRREFQG